MDYMDDGGALYIEGSNVGYDHRTSLFWSYLGAQYLNQGDAYETLDEIYGLTGTFTSPDIFAYGDGDPDYKVDELSAGSGSAILQCQDDIVRAIIYDSGSHRAITSSVTFGVLGNSEGSSFKALLMERYLNFLSGNSGPEFWCSHNELDFGVQYNGYESIIPVAVQNFGLDDLSINSIEVTGANFSIECEPSYLLASGQRIELPVRFYSDDTGDFEGELSLTTNDSDEASVNIPLDVECVEPPVVELTPYEFDVDIHEGQTDQRSLSITNNGPSPLHFYIEIEEADALATSTEIQQNSSYEIEATQLAKGEYDYRQGPPVICGYGGPDNYGYSWVDSDEDGGPEYQWFDISSIGQNSGLSGDDSFVTISIPFDFEFYGVAYHNVSVSTNGYLTFSSDGSTYTNINIPNTGTPNNMICPFWDDLHQQSGTNFYYYDEDNSRFIVQYQNWGFFSGGGTLNFQVHLYESGAIFFYYENLSGTLSLATVGIENANGNDGLQVVYNANYLHSELAIQLCAGPLWLTADVYNGVVAANSSSDVVFTFNAEIVSEGNYSANIIFRCDDPESPETVILASMNVSTTDISDNMLPYTTELNGNYPNPFNNSTVISYSLKERTHVTLDIFNLLGQKVTTIVNQLQDAGNHSVTWQGDISSGVYFYKLTAGDYVTQRKMVLMK